ncbi:hypothetical protein L195_g014586 [Trifolium pratense]|uniref:Uncharacterized protein n=1 Tax=Trifolium pratense TaxID=57577 RepID=A0A2K3PRD5_TRIPR|nr:hypothetical protein L195_g014586 [Trifolium pratense]
MADVSPSCSFQGPGGRFEVMLSLLLLGLNLFVTFRIKNIVKRIRLKRMGKVSSIWKGLVELTECFGTWIVLVFRVCSKPNVDDPPVGMSICIRQSGIPAGIAPFGAPKIGRSGADASVPADSPNPYRGDLWGWGQIFPCEDGDGGKNSPAGTSGRGTEKLPSHIPRPVDIPIHRLPLMTHLID